MASSLDRLVHVEIQNTERLNLVNGSRMIPHKQLLYSDFEYSNAMIHREFNIKTVSVR
jgi:hypothetical protein